MKEIYQVLAGAMGRERQLDQIANNLSNVNTPGFKKDGAAFVDFFKQELLATQTTPAGTAEAPTVNAANSAGSVWPMLAQQTTNFQAGAFQNTEQPLDVAISGPGFFQVEVEGQPGPFYTRAGNFHVSDTGELITPDGRKVLDSGGSPIKLAMDGGAITIGRDGEVHEGITSVGKLGVYEFSDPSVLQHYGETLFRAPQGVTAQAAATPELKQGVLEGSNVNPIQELIAMIQTQRAYQADQKAIQAIDEMTSKRIDSVMNR